jgi:hypothetical protein
MVCLKELVGTLKRLNLKPSTSSFHTIYSLQSAFDWIAEPTRISVEFPNTCSFIDV